MALAEAADHSLPETAPAMIEALMDMVSLLDAQITRLDQQIRRRAREDVPAPLMTIPGNEPITATALAALAPPPETIRKGRDFAA